MAEFVFLHMVFFRAGFYYTPVNDSCFNRDKYFSEQFGDSYITEDFLDVSDDDADKECLKGTIVSNATVECVRFFLNIQ